MPYCDYTDIIERLSERELIDLASETEILDSEAIDTIKALIIDAEEEINSYISSRYETPVVNIPKLLKKITVELTIVNLYKKRNIFSEDMLERQKWVDNILMKISGGQVSLDIETPEELNKILFTSDPLRGW